MQGSIFKVHTVQAAWYEYFTHFLSAAKHREPRFWVELDGCVTYFHKYQSGGLCMWLFPTELPRFSFGRGSLVLQKEKGANVPK